MLQFGLRLGAMPRQLVTTTPRPTPLFKRLVEAGADGDHRAGTAANRGNLAPGFLERVIGRYRGTRLGRQEIDGELIDDRVDALWSRDQIEAMRSARPAELAAHRRRRRSAGLGAQGRGCLRHRRLAGSARATGYVLADASLAEVKPARLGGGGGGALSRRSMPTRSSPRSTRAATW